jgi:hypothetical protein
MPITIQPYTNEHVESVRRFNDRLKVGGVAIPVPLSPDLIWLPQRPGRRLFQEYRLAVDQEGEVRGAYILKHQDFRIGDQVVGIADFRQQVSEGAVDSRYPYVGVQMLRDALVRQPMLFGLGIGGYDMPLTQLLQAAGWKIIAVPFFFRVIRPVAFLRNIVHLRRHASTRWLLDALAMTGLGWAGIRAAQKVYGRRLPRDAEVVAEEVSDFSAWTEELWEQRKGKYGMTAVRNLATLQLLYPQGDSRFIRLRITDRSRPIGWAVVLDTPLQNHNYFGDMRLGSIVDGFAAPDDAFQVVATAKEFLKSRGADLIVSNQSHLAWRRGFRRVGFFQGPSNFLLALSPQLAELLRRQNVSDEAIYVNRGDGDGPINL